MNNAYICDDISFRFHIFMLEKRAMLGQFEPGHNALTPERNTGKGRGKREGKEKRLSFYTLTFLLLFPLITWHKGQDNNNNFISEILFLLGF